MELPLPFITLEKSVGIHFRNKEYLMRALTHRSAVRQARANGHNERLEFLGDAVLELVATEYLFQYKDKSEGELTNWRAALVRGEHLAKVARDIQLGQYLFMSNGEEASGGREKDSTLANAVEAFIGAVFLDQGYETAKEFCYERILVHLNQLIAQGRDRDHKSVFQEKSQEFKGVTPHYEVVSEVGPDHDKIFTCAAYIDDELIAKGEGNSKQRAEQEAAKKALAKLKWS